MILDDSCPTQPWNSFGRRKHLLMYRVTDLHQEQTTGRKPSRCLFDDRTDEIQTIGSSLQGDCGLVLENVAIERTVFVVGDIGRVGADQVEASKLLFPQRFEE